MDPKEHLILYVDDERSNRIVFEQTFGRRFRTKCVESATLALDVLEKETVAVLITDQRMPKVSGDELLARAKIIAPHTLRMIITAYSDLDPILRAVNDGLVVRYIIKPWNRAELEETLQWALEMFEVGRISKAIQVRLLETERVLTLGNVAAMVLHDLRQPLSSLSLMASELSHFCAAVPLLSRLGTASALLDEPERRRLLDAAEALPEIADGIGPRVSFMLEVVNRLSQFVQRDAPSSGTRDADPAPAVRVAVAMCRDAAVVAGSSVINEVPANLPRVRATSAELMQIVINLVRNAQQAVEHANEGLVTVRASDEADCVRFVVQDNGVGMSPQVLASLGTPFFTTRPDGTGLGMAQVRRVVGSVGGSIQIESTEKSGTIVTFTIPKAV
jgi:signal transduction histidine kinase